MRVGAVAAFALCLAGNAHAQPAVSDADRAAIREVVTAQIAAFRHDDAVAAFSFAAPNIKARFGDAQHFLAMVRSVYPAVFRPRSFTFGSLTREASTLQQKVGLIGPDGASALALYSMEHEADGTWRIAGCALIKAPSREI
ncbi:DUF4864 domain-containing protein [Lichenicoccus sp.]|uniref:DUF4864 domain-containing protein n=1 Tax=Lichenicoccus sp. TaxID=2781899 RepID=UPI003D0CB055